MSDDKRPPQGSPATREPPTAFDSVDPPRNFTLTTEERVRAMTIGVPAYAARKRKLEDREAEMIAALVELHDTLTGKRVPPEDVRRAVEARAREFNLAKLNAIVDAHNRYYPIEANLRIDPRTGGYLIFGHPWSPEPPWSVERLLALYAGAIAARR